MSREDAPSQSQGVGTDEVLYLFTICDGTDSARRSSGILGTLAVGCVPLTAFEPGAPVPRLLVAKLVAHSNDACRDKARSFLQCALDAFGPELGLPASYEGPIGDDAGPSPVVGVLDDGAGGFDFFCVGPNDGEPWFAPVFSMRRDVPARSIQALELLFPADAHRALSSIAEFSSNP